MMLFDGYLLKDVQNHNFVSLKSLRNLNVINIVVDVYVCLGTSRTKIFVTKSASSRFESFELS